ncbi:MAG: A/G-specific adenine glycosylase [Spirochaetota bacterium]
MNISQTRINRFQQRIWNYYRENGRPFPWRDTDNPYEILVSELMLQQTQTERVLKKYQPFLDRFPAFEALAQAPLSEVLQLWQGLGYNRRALGLKRIAELVHTEYGGELPDDPETLISFPMIGPATAGSLQAFIFNRPAAFIETNIRRVVLYFFFESEEKVKDGDVLSVVERVLDRSAPRHWYYALMDYGVYLKYSVPNPNRRSAHYRRQAPFENSNRQIRGALLRLITAEGPLTKAQLTRALNEYDYKRVDSCLNELECEGFIAADKAVYRIK